MRSPPKASTGSTSTTYPNSANGLFDFTVSHGQWQAAVHPLYYGALMFAQAAPAGSRLLPINAAAQTGVRAWATAAPTRRSASCSSTTTLAVRPRRRCAIPGGDGAAAVERLGGPSVYATGGISLGGASFGTDTATGVLPAPTPQAVAARAGGYAVRLPPAAPPC